VAEADEIQRRGRGQLEARCSFDPLAERLRERDVTADVVAQAFDAIVADHEPELERAKPPSERDLPVPVVDDRSGFGRAISQVFGEHAQGTDQ